MLFANLQGSRSKLQISVCRNFKTSLPWLPSSKMMALLTLVCNTSGKPSDCNLPSQARWCQLSVLASMEPHVDSTSNSLLLITAKMILPTVTRLFLNAWSLRLRLVSVSESTRFVSLIKMAANHLCLDIDSQMKKAWSGLKMQALPCLLISLLPLSSLGMRTTFRLWRCWEEVVNKMCLLTWHLRRAKEKFVSTCLKPRKESLDCMGTKIVRAMWEDSDSLS